MMPQLVFTVRRQEPELVAPAKPTPRELKPLSDIDDQEGLRFQVPGIQFCRKVASMEGKDPVRVIRDGIAQALVFYYPVAGRIREGPGRKLSVDCTDEGILFIEADADVALEDFGPLQPPFPCFDELLYDVPGSSDIIDCPLLLCQVTRLKCGGFVSAFRLNHTLMDAYGLTQFFIAVAEMAFGAHAPSTLPIWNRDIFKARDPPRVTCAHPEYDQVDGTIIPLDGDMVHRSFFFGRAEVSALRRFAPDGSHRYSTFEVLTACLWRCRTLALRPDPEEVVRMYFLVNLRGKDCDVPVPVGYYGNALTTVVALTAAGKLCERPLGYALELLREAKAKVNKEYVQSLADLMVIRGRPHVSMVQAYMVSDVMKADIRHVDNGWGQAVYTGPPMGGLGPVPESSSFYVPSRNNKGENGILVPICLPHSTMDTFQIELNAMLSDQLAPSQLVNSKL